MTTVQPLHRFTKEELLEFSETMLRQRQAEQHQLREATLDAFRTINTMERRMDDVFEKHFQNQFKINT